MRDKERDQRLDITYLNSELRSGKSSLNMEAGYFLNSTGLLQGYVSSPFSREQGTDLQDAAFLLPQTSDGPLHCTSPEDIYLLLKSSDFLTHAITPERVYEGCENVPSKEGMKLELILRKYESSRINPSREFRCFVGNDILLGTL
jgi:hypothetical protein